MNYHDSHTDHDDERQQSRLRVPRLWILLGMIVLSWVIVIGVVWVARELLMGFLHLIGAL